jgi:hypothetical protein
LCVYPAYKGIHIQAGIPSKDCPPVGPVVAAKWIDYRAVQQLLVVYYKRQQYRQRVEREHEQWQREQQQ